MRVIGLSGWSGAGKTTLLSRVIPLLVARGLTVSTVKHAHHGFDVDIPGKDSHTHRMVGASEVFVSSGARWAHVHELRGEEEPDLEEILKRLTPVDLVIVEGFKRHRHPKLEVYRAALGKPCHQPVQVVDAVLLFDFKIHGVDSHRYVGASIAHGRSVLAATPSASSAQRGLISTGTPSLSLTPAPRSQRRC